MSNNQVLFVSAFPKHLDFRRHGTFFKLMDSDADNSLDNSIEISPNDVLSLVPFGRFHNAFPLEISIKLEPDEEIDYFVKKADPKYFIKIEKCHDTLLDLFSLFILNTKKVKYNDYDKYSIFDVHFSASSNLVFNGRFAKYKNCWFLDFDS